MNRIVNPRNEESTDLIETFTNSDYLYARLSADQTTNLAAGQHVEFDTVVNSRGTSITMSTGSGQANGLFTLTSGKSYLIYCQLAVDHATNGFILYGMYDSENTLIYPRLYAVNISWPDELALSSMLQAICSPSSQMVIRQSCMGNNGGDAVLADNSFMFVKQIKVED